MLLQFSVYPFFLLSVGIVECMAETKLNNKKYLFTLQRLVFCSNEFPNFALTCFTLKSFAWKKIMGFPLGTKKNLQKQKTNTPKKQKTPKKKKLP